MPGISRKTGGDPSSDRLHDFPGCFGAVHGIEVDAVCAVGLQIQNLAHCIVDARLSHIFRLIAVCGDQIRQLFGMLDPDSVTVVPSCLAEVMGMMPAHTGSEMPAVPLRSRKR